MSQGSNQKLVKVDFSNGIRAGAINDNFNYLEDAIARERLAIAGHGISNGFDFTINDFDVSISAGSLIDNAGHELFLGDQGVTIQLPRLIKVEREVMTINENGKLFLPHVPYNPNRKQIARLTDANHGIEIVDFSNASTVIQPSSLEDNVLTFHSLSRKSVRVTYYYTDRRYDTVYIDQDDRIAIAEGTTSGSPSVVIPDKEVTKYVLGFLEIDPFYADIEKGGIAKLKLKQDLRAIRTVYTDANNELYLCGEPFKDLQIIRMIEPEDPSVNTLWYDIDQNLLKVWVITEGIGQWIAVNNTAYTNVLKWKLWRPEENPLDLKRFIFKAEELDLRFTPGNNCLTVFVDQASVHSDQFQEITLLEAKTDAKFKAELIADYGYTEEDIENADKATNNIGIGFKFANPLYNTCYIEARIVHRANASPKTRFERSATFVNTGVYRVGSNDSGVITTSPYRYKENQLEVYLNGSRLVLNEDFFEANEFDALPDKGTLCNSFRINENKLSTGDVVDYRITTSVFSYDHLQGLLDHLDTRFAELFREVKSFKDEMHEYKLATEERLQTIEAEILALKNPAAVARTAETERTPIVEEYTLKGQTLTINCLPEDEFSLYKLDGERYIGLVRGVKSGFGDYYVLAAPNNKSKIVFNNPAFYQKGDHIVVNGYSA